MKLNKYKLIDVATCEISNIDKKTKSGEQAVQLCNFTDVYYNWAVTESMSDKFMVATASDSQISKLSLKKGQVAITKDSETRHDIGIPCYIADTFKDCVLGYHCALITPNSELLDGRYLNAYLNSKLAKEYFANNATGSGMRYSLSVDTIKDIILYLPDIETQRAIGEIFSNIDRKITLNREINRNLEAMARQLYDYWFVQFDFPDENGRPYKSSGGKMVWNEKLKREIPEGWCVDNILSICEIKVGGTPSKSNNIYWDNGTIPFFGPTDVSDNIYQLDTIDHITHEGLAHCASSLFQIGDVILTARGSIGKMVIVGEPMAMNQSCYALVPKYPNTPYLYFLSKELIEWLKAKGSGSVFKSFNAQDVEYSQLCIAPRTIITKFCNSVNCLFEQLRLHTQEITKLITQRDELLPLLMNGQVSVMPTEVNCDLALD